MQSGEEALKSSLVAVEVQRRTGVTPVRAAPVRWRRNPTLLMRAAMSTTLKTYIVEDNKVIRDNLISALEELVPVKVVGTADDENTAVQWLALKDNDADLVIIDIFLREGSGLGVLRAAKDMPPRQSLVVLSNYATPDMRRKCMELGASRVFDKSNEIDDLILYCGRLANGETGHGALSSV
jgi:DNA-binding NarL/FixJ family response regulator